MKRQEGVTLLEVLLVIVISMGLVYLSIQQYLSYRRDADIQEMRANVDTLFTSLAKYFRANCRADPNFQTLTTNQVIRVSMTTLRTRGFLTQTIARNPLVDATGADQGYIMQFNLYNPGTLPNRTIDKSGGGTYNVGRIAIWRIQVSVHLIPSLRTATNALSIKNAASADCLTNTGGGAAQKCSSPPPGANAYIAWDRLPSLSSSAANSTYWLTMPVLKEFTQMYTTDPILILTDQSQTIKQIYKCGS